MDMVRVRARRIPRFLSENYKVKHIQLSRSVLRRHEHSEDAFISRVSMADKTWLFYFDPETKQPLTLRLQLETLIDVIE